MSKIKCRNCGKELIYNVISDIPTFPFCSKRCKLIDLGQWFDVVRRIEDTTSDQPENDDT